MLSEEDVPHFSIQETDKINTVYGFAEEFYIKINRISNQEEVHDVDIPKRSCRFPNENYINIYPVYSVSACLVNCRRNLQLQLCNCTSYYMPNGGRFQGLSSELFFHMETRMGRHTALFRCVLRDFHPILILIFSYFRLAKEAVACQDFS